MHQLVVRSSALTINEMYPQEILNNFGQVIGRVYRLSSGLVQLYNPKGIFVGFYNPLQNSTYNAAGNKIGAGNLLRSLLEPSRDIAA